MHKALHGAVMGLLIGGPATLMAWFMITNAVNKGSWAIWIWVIGWVVWGAILGMLLPKHK